MFDRSGQLVLRSDFPETQARDLLSAVGFADWALAFVVACVPGLRRCVRALATVPPGNQKSEDNVEAAKAGGQKPVRPGCWGHYG